MRSEKTPLHANGGCDCHTTTSVTRTIAVGWPSRASGCSAFTKKSVESNGKVHQHHAEGYRLINRALEDAGERCVCVARHAASFARLSATSTEGDLHPVSHTHPGKGSFANVQHDVWRGILALDKHVIRGVKNKVFAGSFRTDGVSVRLLFGKPARTYGKRKRGPSDARPPVEHMPTRGLYAIDQLKHLTRNFQVVGADRER